MNSDNEFLKIIRPAECMLVAAATVLVVVCIGMAILLVYGYKAEVHERTHKNQMASDYVASLYQEAESASRVAQRLADQACSDETLRQLRHIVAVNSHLRSINIFSRDGKGCSSLEGYLPATDVTHRDRLPPFFTTMRQEDGYLFYMVYFRSPKNLTGVAINGYYVRDALHFISPEAAFFPLQDFMDLSPQGYAWKNTQYPFVLVSAESINFRELIVQCRWIIFFIISVSLFTGWLAYISIGLLNTPRNALKYYLWMNRFYPVYQPVISTKDHRVAGLEILMRCINQKGHEVSPAVFIPLAEQCSMIKPLTRQLLTKVVADLSLFAGQGLYLAVNITHAMVECPQTLSELLKFAEQARKYNLEVLLEITERQSFSLTAGLAEKLILLREAGLKIAVDDFGTGYSNLSSITELSPDYLKIDKDFTGYSQAGGIREILLESILHLSATTAIPVIAEGIETPAQFNYMRDRGVWLFQGYLFSRPCDARRISDFILRYPANLGRR